MLRREVAAKGVRRGLSLMAYWAALRMRVNCEKRVIACLGDLGFETYFPTVMVDLKRRGR
jgi:hypothetical protein